MSEIVKEVENKAGYLFQASIQIGDRMALTVSGNLPVKAEAKEIETELDRIFNAMEKQETKRMKIPAIKGALGDQKDALERTKKQYEELAFQEQGRKLNNAEKAQQDTCSKQIKALTEQVEKGQQILEAMEKAA
jgi:archaellum component FlaC